MPGMEEGQEKESRAEQRLKERRKERVKRRADVEGKNTLYKNKYLLRKC